MYVTNHLFIFFHIEIYAKSPLQTVGSYSNSTQLISMWPRLACDSVGRTYYWSREFISARRELGRLVTFRVNSCGLYTCGSILCRRGDGRVESNCDYIPY